MNRASLLCLGALLPSLVCWSPDTVNPFDIASMPTPLRGFDDVMTVLNSGGVVRVVLDYAKCQLQAADGSSTAGPNAIGGMALETWEYFAKGAVGNPRAYVSASESKLVGRKKQDGTFVHVLNYVKVRYYDDNTVEVNAQYLVPTTYEVKMDETFICKVNNGHNPAHGASFYRGK